MKIYKEAEKLARQIARQRNISNTVAITEIENDVMAGVCLGIEYVKGMTVADMDKALEEANDGAN